MSAAAGSVDRTAVGRRRKLLVNETTRPVSATIHQTRSKRATAVAAEGVPDQGHNHRDAG